MTVAISTAWHEHPELWPDYHAVIEDAQPDEVWINGNAGGGWHPAVSVSENLGFCAGSNAGLRAATTDTVVFLNNDVRLITPGWLDRLLAPLEPGVLVGALLRNDAHTSVDGHRIPYLDGWCLAGMRDDLLALGGFDETLAEPAYYSDNLLCLEARAAGMTLREVPGVGLHHKTGTTTRSGSRDRTATASAANRERYAQRARELLVAA